MPIPIAFLIAILTTAEPIVPPDAKVEQVATGFRFTEGPALAPDGSIYFTDIPSNRIHRYDPASGAVTTVHENTGGANGLVFDNEGKLVACCGKRRAVVRYLKDGGDFEVLASQFEGKKLNSPNDVVILFGHNIYFTDPRYGKRDDLEQPHDAVYHRWHGGNITRMITGLQRPNGIAASPNQMLLYVSDNQAKSIHVYEQNYSSFPEETGRLFASREGPGGPDGMTVDRIGNVYAAWHGGGGVHVWNPAGDHIGFIATPEQPANCTFAADGGTLYITATKSLYRVVLNVP